MNFSYTAMMKLLEKLQSNRRELLDLASHNGAYNIRLFGSVVRGEEGPESDVDFLVDMEKGRSLLDLVALQDALSKEINRPVDVVTAESLNSLLKDCILSEAIPL